MSCPNCRSELPIQHGFCPACRAYVGERQKPAAAQEKFLWMLAFLGVMAIVGSGYFFTKSGKARQVFQKVLTGQPVTFGKPMEPRLGMAREVPVVHGAVAGAKDLTAHGKLYFVPMGRQAISVQSLAEYYREKFNIGITILKKVDLRPSSCVPHRRQCIAEQMLIDVALAYPQLLDDPDAKLIVLTDEDIYPVSMGLKFTYSYREGHNWAVVSTHRMDPAFWRDPPDEAKRLANTRQMLTKYIGVLYFLIPGSHDPTSVMYEPLTPNGGSDDIYLSDLHPEESPNGRLGDGWACLSFHYSYKDHQVVPTVPAITECYDEQFARSADEEIVQVELNSGQFIDHSMEFEMDSTPKIEMRRGSRSDVHLPRALGLGTDYYYDTFLGSDGIEKLGQTNIIYPDRYTESLSRSTNDIGFSPDMTFQNRNSEGEFFGSKMIWETDHFKSFDPDGSWSTYLACPTTPECYWMEYHDPQGNSLHFDRFVYHTLRRVTASDGHWVEFKPDAQRRIVEANSSNGDRVQYAYDAYGCLSRVTRVDGQVTVYRYDSDHRVTEVAVASKPDETPLTFISNKYDFSGRVVKVQVNGIGTFQIQYELMTGDRTGYAKVITPSGQVWRLDMDEHEYLAGTTPLRFPAAIQARNHK